MELNALKSAVLKLEAENESLQIACLLLLASSKEARELLGLFLPNADALLLNRDLTDQQLDVMRATLALLHKQSQYVADQCQQVPIPGAKD